MFERTARADTGKHIKRAIDDGGDIEFITYTFMDDTDEKIQMALTCILEKYKKDDLSITLFSCVKELMANALKANARRILVEEGIISNPEDSMEVAEKVRAIISDKTFADFGMKAKKRGLSAKIHFKILNKSLVIDVVNNTPLQKKEIERINKKIQKCYEYDDIARYYIENPDPTAEGMGLGLSMIVILLKTIPDTRIDFNFSSDCTDMTLAQLRISLE